MMKKTIPCGHSGRVALYLILMFVIVLAVPFGRSLHAQEKKIWTLRNCIDYSIENNLNIKKQQLYNQITEQTLLQSKAGLLPDLNGQVSHFINYGNIFDIYTNTYKQGTTSQDNFQLGSSVTLFNGFQLINTIKKNKLDLQAGKYDLDKMMDDISLEITVAYLNILYNKELLAVAQNQADISKQQVERTRKLVNAGTLAQGSLLDLEAQAATEELNVVTAQNNLDLAYLTLTQLLDLPSTVGFEVDVPDIDIQGETPIILKPEDVFQYAAAHQPVIKGAEYRLESAQRTVEIAKGTRYPNLSLSGALTTRYSDGNKETLYEGNPEYLGTKQTPYFIELDNGDRQYVFYDDYSTPFRQQTTSFGDQVDDNFYKYIGLSLNIPIFNGLVSHTNIKKARLSAEDTDLDLQLARLNLRKTIEQAYGDARAALNRHQASRKSVTALEEAFKYTDQKYNVGLLTSVDYNLAKNQLLEAQSNMLQAKYDYIFRLKVLDFYMGKPLGLEN
jgi:outer membrane protein